MTCTVGPNTVIVKFETFRIKFEIVCKSSRKSSKKFESNFNVRVSPD